jgi:hypothetical protein
MASIFWWGRRPSLEASTRRPLRRLAGHRFDDAGDHHLQAAAGGRGRHVDVGPLRAPFVHEDPVVGDELAADELFHLADGVENAPGDVFGGFFHRGRGLAANLEAVLVALLADEDGFGRGAAAVGGQDGLCVRKVHG